METQPQSPESIAIPPRPPESHKGTFGHVLLVGGSRGMGGAAALGGMAALRSGAGLVTIAVPASVQPTVAAYHPCYMTIGLMESPGGTVTAAAAERAVEFAERCAVVAVGPGIGRAPGVAEFVRTLYQHIAVPLVLDADGLYVMAEQSLDAPAARILTPHPGEFRRLVHAPELSIAACREMAPAWAEERGLVLVLKGHQTMVTDGHRTEVNRTGNPGMATGGTGDVLTGVIAALLAQGLAPWEAARLAVHVHGLAGDLAATQLGQVSLIATDVVDFLPRAFQQLAEAAAD